MIEPWKSGTAYTPDLATSPLYYDLWDDDININQYYLLHVFFV